MSVAKLDNQLCFALYSASNHITSIYRPLLEPLGLTYPQFVVLMALWQQDNTSISQLADKAGLSKATMTPLLKRLEQKGFIERQVLPSNERQKNISLTAKGKKLSSQSIDITEKVFCATGLTKKQANMMIEHCKSIVAS
ncbi:MAG: MarR family transcriptional regulator [Pseudomonadota bacterium]